MTAPRVGTFPNGMDFLTWGGGAKTLLFLPGGPGSAIPTGLFARMSQGWFDPFVDEGYAIWFVTRRRNMPEGHSVQDMADDYALLIADEFDGRVDLVVGESFGGMVAQYLAAEHGDTWDQLALVVAAVEVNDWGKEVDSRLCDALAEGDRAAFGTAFAEYVLPGERSRWARRVLGPMIARSLLSGKSYPPADLLVELEAEIAYDARPALPRIEAPVVLITGDRDQFFPMKLVEETARLIPDCTLVVYEGQGHMKAAMNKRVAHDVLRFVNHKHT